MTVAAAAAVVETGEVVIEEVVTEVVVTEVVVAVAVATGVSTEIAVVAGAPLVVSQLIRHVLYTRTIYETFMLYIYI